MFDNMLGFGRSNNVLTLTWLIKCRKVMHMKYSHNLYLKNKIRKDKQQINDVSCLFEYLLSLCAGQSLNWTEGLDKMWFVKIKEHEYFFQGHLDIQPVRSQFVKVTFSTSLCFCHFLSPNIFSFSPTFEVKVQMQPCRWALSLSELKRKVSQSHFICQGPTSGWNMSPPRVGFFSFLFLSQGHMSSCCLAACLDQEEEELQAFIRCMMSPWANQLLKCWPGVGWGDTGWAGHQERQKSPPWLKILWRIFLRDVQKYVC